MTRLAILRVLSREGALTSVDEQQGIHRREVLAIVGALADTHANTLRILQILEEDGEDDEEPEEVDP
jgi:hypothetical protein